MKKLLSVALAIFTAVPAFSFGLKAAKSNDMVGVFPGKVNIEKKSERKPVTRAAVPDSVNFSYAGPVGTAVTLRADVAPVGDTIYIAFEIPARMAAMYAGDEITRLNVTTGAFIKGNGYINAVKDIKIFTAESKEATPKYLQDATLGNEAFTEYSIKLDNPVKIEGDKSILLGYCFAVPAANTYYVPVDMIPTNEPEASIVGVKGKDSKEPTTWTSFAEDYGSTCLGCTIQGENYPANGAALFDLFGPLYTAPGEEFIYQFLIHGTGVLTETVEFVSTIGNGAPKSQVIELPVPLPYGDFEIVEVPLQCDEEGMEVSMKFELTKVNGEENNSVRNTLNGVIECLSKDKVFPRVNLIEEGTGTWCGFCPRGIVMMDYVASTYPDMFAGVALHSNDQMSTPTVNTALGNLFNNYPSAVINRVNNISGDMSPDAIDNFAMVYGTLPSLIGFDSVEATVGDDGKVNVDVAVKVGVEMENTKDRYRLAFYLTQDGMGPYQQANSYAGGRYGEMDGWENEKNKVSTIYNEVARYLAGGFTGFAKSFPEVLKPGEEYKYNASFSVKTVSSKEFNLIAFIVDNVSGEVVNAYEIEVENPYYSGVNEITSDGDVVARKFYDISGVEVKEPTNGIYIVRSVYSDGAVKTSKSVVK